MKKINKEDLQNILNKHKLWLLDDKTGECANLDDVDLSGVDLSGVDLRNTKLRYANLSETDLSNANLRSADLSNADLRYVNLSGGNLSGADLRFADLTHAKLSNVKLRYADLSGADLSNAKLRYADLSNVDLRYADLSGADLSNADLRSADLSNVKLRYADLSGVDLRYADLSGADLSNADLKHIKTNYHTLGYHLACPEKGSFIGYKKAFGYLITLLILEDAKRSSATTLKCRCDKAKVLEIKNIISGESISKIESEHDEKFIYEVGEIVKVEDFDNDRWNECSTGIHFFMNKENAINY